MSCLLGVLKCEVLFAQAHFFHACHIVAFDCIAGFLQWRERFFYRNPRGLLELRERAA
jgi:hypothetical protein